MSAWSIRKANDRQVLSLSLARMHWIRLFGWFRFAMYFDDLLCLFLSWIDK